jgi:hypothetical protein
MKLALSMIVLVIVLCCGLPSLAPAQTGGYQHGSVVRMHMGDCVLAQHGFLSTVGGPAIAMPGEPCPEYTLLSNDVVYVIVGRSSNQLVPLAESIAFRLHKNELLVRVDDAKKEIRFTIKDMIVRSEWDHLQRHIEEQMRAAELRETSR